MIAEIPGQRRPDTHKLLQGLAALFGSGVAALVILAVSLSFLWPRQESTSPPLYAGDVNHFSIGRPVLLRTESGEPIWLVRLNEHEVIALGGLPALRGCAIQWLPQFEFNGVEGWFRDPCYLSTYDIRGVRVFGPAPYNMDRYEVRSEGDSVVVITDERHIQRTTGKDLQPRSYFRPSQEWKWSGYGFR